MTLLGFPLDREGPTAQPLRLPPLIGRPTATAVELSVMAGERALELELRLGIEPRRDEQAPAEPTPGEPALEVRPLDDGARLQPLQVRELLIDGLKPGTAYRFELTARAGSDEQKVAGRFVTQRPEGSTFAFVVMADPHLPVPSRWLLQADERHELLQLRGFLQYRTEIARVFLKALQSIRTQSPDFIISLGDQFDLHALGFNPSFPDAELVELAYQDFRGCLGATGSEAALFTVVGNWDGENGDLPESARRFAIEARKKYILNPRPSTYPEGGSADGNYYAWSWGDTLCVVLDVMGPTRTTHTLGHMPDEGTATDWTLGRAQLEWLEKTLARSRATFKMLFIHHAVGGNAGDEVNSAYGRGGGRAARVGEQATLHALMQKHGVQIFFYGHDHVFTDMVVDGIHYTLPGSVGAPWKFDAGETGYESFDPRSGFALVHVSPSRLRVEFLDLSGKVFNAYEVAADSEPSH
ncbi:MAG: metallophosphoesterase [Planctomycetota bacterium]